MIKREEIEEILKQITTMQEDSKQEQQNRKNVNIMMLPVIRKIADKEAKKHKLSLSRLVEISLIKLLNEVHNRE